MSLNAEPSQPEERAAHDLPPKSYAEAAEEAREAPHSHADQTDGTPHVHHAADAVQKVNAEEFEGAGLDSSPRSPTRGHRRKTSHHSNGSIGRKHGEHIHATTEDHHGDGDTLASLRSSTNPKPLARRRSTLQTGRRAGAGWSRSKCVPQHDASRLVPALTGTG